MIDLRTSALVDALAHRPWDFAFLQVCRWMEARTGHLPRIGEALHPQNELLRLGQTPASTFAPREIDSADLKRGRLHIRQFGLGLYGPGGPLPLHLTEEIHERQIQLHDNTLADFLDMFHHRWLSLFYRAWAQGQSAAGLDRRHDERFSVYVAALLGHHPGFRKTDPAGTAGPATPIPPQTGQAPPQTGQVPPHARLAAAGHLVRHSRNPAGLLATLEAYFGLPFRLTEYSLQWLKLEQEDCVQLGRGRHPLGQDTVLGRHVPDRQSTVTLHMEPPDFAAYARLLPGADWHAGLVRWLRCFTGLELHWELRLSLPADKAPPCRLGRGVQLGRTGWLQCRSSGARLQGRSSTA